MSNQIQNPNNKTKYDLKERTLKYSREVINFVKQLPNNSINKPLISQLIRSATSIGANYMEADCAESKKDFRHKISICKKEAKETTYWMQVIESANLNIKEDCKKLWKEAHEFTLIFSSILRK